MIDSAKTPILQSANSSHSVNEGSSDSNSGFALVVPPQGTITASSPRQIQEKYFNSLTFDSTNWQTAQALTFQGVEDYLQDGDQNISINYILSSTVTTEPTHGTSGVFTVSNADSRLRLIIVSIVHLGSMKAITITQPRFEWTIHSGTVLNLSSPDTGK